MFYAAPKYLRKFYHTIALRAGSCHLVQSLDLRRCLGEAGSDRLDKLMCSNAAGQVSNKRPDMISKLPSAFLSPTTRIGCPIRSVSPCRTCRRPRKTLTCASTTPAAAVLPAALEEAANVSLHDFGLVIKSVAWQPPTLTVYISSTTVDDGGATLEDCATASGVVGTLLDDADFGGDAGYTLEVSTPGAADVLTEEREFVAFKGFPVRVVTTEPFKGRGEFEGRLVGRSDSAVRVGVAGRVIDVPRSVVAEVRLCQGVEE